MGSAALSEVAPTNAVCFEPMDLGIADCAVVESHGGNTLHFPPMPAAVAAIEMLPDPNTGTAGDDDGAGDWRDQFESHFNGLVTPMSRSPLEQG
jgi:hypothetical protein